MKKIITCCVILSLLAANVCFYYNLGGELSLMIIIVGLFVFAKIMVSFYFMQGSNLFETLKLKKKSGIRYWTIKTFKMPLKHVILMSLPFFSIVILVYFSFCENVENCISLQTVNNLRAFSLVVVFSIGASFLYWIFNWREFFFASEYDVRVKLRNDGNSPEVVEDKIQQLRNSGIFG